MINPTHITDATNAIKHAVELQGIHKINIAGPEVLSLRKIGEIIGKLIGHEPLFEANLNDEPANIIGDIARMKSLLGSPEIHFENGIKRIIKATYRVESHVLNKNCTGKK